MSRTSESFACTTVMDRHSIGTPSCCWPIRRPQEDAVQQVFTSVLRSGASTRLEADEPYLRRATRNECYSMLRRRRIRDPIQVEPDALLEQIASVDSKPDERPALEGGFGC